MYKRQIFSTDKVFSAMRILLSVQSDLTAPCRLHQSRHEETEKGTSFKKCETNKKVQHDTPQSMQMQGNFWSSAIRVMLWLARYFWNR